MASRFRKIATRIVVIGGGGLAAAYGLASLYDNHQNKLYMSIVEASEKGGQPRPTAPLLPRASHLKALQEMPEYDVLVIGGGATGAGVVLDAVSRGLTAAVVEIDDFSSGTSSRSTKLIHGGVRYLQKAIMKLDYDQYRMVKEALYERANLLAIAPHLSSPLPIMLPVYRWWQVPYYWFGIKAYDIVAGSKLVKSSYYLSKTKALELFPMLKKDKLCGAIVYYDGQHNDARMNLALVLTAARMGANVANHVGVTSLIKKTNAEGKLVVAGAMAKDMLTGKEFEIRAKCVINATGPFTDTIRQMDDPNTPKICQPSSGVHVILPDYYSPEKMGLLDPDTSDGRVIFFLPWEGATIAGTTDKSCDVTHNPAPTEDDIQFILQEVRHYLTSDIEVRRGDVLSAWAGIRPLVLDPNKPITGTESIARNHIIHTSESNLITIAGGKWTTYRAMAYETIDEAVKRCNLKPKTGSLTDGLLLEGAHQYSPTMFIKLVQDYGLENEVAQHLANTYGDRAFSVAKLTHLTGKRWPVVGKRLHEEFPYIDAEVRYAVREYACTAVDVIARRLRLAFLNVQACEEALPAIITIMAEELGWSKAEQKVQHEKAVEFLKLEMGQDVNKASKENLDINLTKEEIRSYVRRFETLDAERKGFISVNDLRRSFKKFKEVITEEQLHELLREVDLNKNGEIDLSEYLQMMNAIKSGVIAYSRLAMIADTAYQQKLSVERSGGGL